MMFFKSIVLILLLLISNGINLNKNITEEVVNNNLNGDEYVEVEEDSSIIPYDDINEGSEDDLALNVYNHHEPQYSRVVDRIKNRINLDEEYLVFKFDNEPKTLIIGDSRVCGLRKTDYGKNCDLIGLSGATSYNINDIAKYIPDDYYERIIAWFSVNDYGYLNKKDISTLSEIANFKNIELNEALDTLSAKCKNDIYYIENTLGKKQPKYDIKNSLLKKTEKEISENGKCIVLSTIVKADSKHCYDGVHFTLEGSQLIIDNVHEQIDYIEGKN